MTIHTRTISLPSSLLNDKDLIAAHRKGQEWAFHLSQRMVSVLSFKTHASDIYSFLDLVGHLLPYINHLSRVVSSEKGLVKGDKLLVGQTLLSLSLLRDVVHLWLL